MWIYLGKYTLWFKIKIIWMEFFERGNLNIKESYFSNRNKITDHEAQLY